LKHRAVLVYENVLFAEGCSLKKCIFFVDENDPLNCFIHYKNYVSFCLNIAPEGEQTLWKKVAFYEHIYEHIQSPPTPSRKILFDP
jgi:hypothetical protein